MSTYRAGGGDIVAAGGLATSDYHDLHGDPSESKCYTRSFGGTSGASSIVAGAVACVNGVLKAAGKSPLTPLAMRDLLKATGTPQAASPDAPLTQHIGPLPNIRAALQQVLKKQ